MPPRTVVPMLGSFTWTSGAAPGVVPAVNSSTCCAVRVSFSTLRRTGFSFASTRRRPSGARAIQVLAGQERAYTPRPTTSSSVSTTTAAPAASGNPMRFNLRTRGTSRKYSITPITRGSRNSRAARRV